MRICDIKGCGQEAIRRVEPKVYCVLDDSEIMDARCPNFVRLDVCEEHLVEMNDKWGELILGRFLGR